MIYIYIERERERERGKCNIFVFKKKQCYDVGASGTFVQEETSLDTTNPVTSGSLCCRKKTSRDNRNPVLGQYLPPAVILQVEETSLGVKTFVLCIVRPPAVLFPEKTRITQIINSISEDIGVFICFQRKLTKSSPHHPPSPTPPPWQSKNQ